MKSKLSQKEQRQIIDKLRNEYFEYAKKYSPKIFDINPFEERLQYVLKKGFNIDAFLLTEITTLEQVKQTVEQRIERTQNRFINKVDKIIEENNKKIAQYPEYIIHPKASSELQKLLGALNSFTHQDFHIIEHIILSQKDQSIKTKWDAFIEKINFYILERNQRFAPRIEDHILLLNRKNIDHSEIELAEKHFIKDIALFLNDIKDYLILITYNNVLSEYEKIFQSHEISIESSKQYSGKSYKEILIKIIQNLKNIINDFRLQEIRSR